MKHYYTLLTRRNRNEDWSPEFGSYDRSEVKEEADIVKYEDGYQTQIIKTSEEQDRINYAVSCINAEATLSRIKSARS